MKKNELIATLNSIEGNPNVYLASDEEGNSFSELYEVAYDDDDSEDGVSLVFENGGPVIVLWP